MARRILIVGGSTRAAADSVRRAGWQPICADLFADQDLRRNAEVIPVRAYPDSLPEDVARVRADGWFYCGALENHPKIIERMSRLQSQIGPLIGTPPNALKRVRDPYWLTMTLRDAGVCALEVLNSSNPPPPDGLWVQKPIASGGGRAIRVWDEAAARDTYGESHYFQRRAPGSRLSAIFDVHERRITWLGASRELEPISRNKPPSAFSYCGSCGPLKRIPFTNAITTLPVSRCRLFAKTETRSVSGCAVYQQKVQRQLTTIARSLVKNAAGLRGLIGLDFRLDGDKVWLTEVNPRYTASIEILELASGRSLLNPKAQRDHLPTAPLNSQHRLIAKRILYAKSKLKVPDLDDYLGPDHPWQLPMIADIPAEGSTIAPGWPICTVFGGGATVEAVENSMIQRVIELQSLFSQTNNSLDF